MGKHVVYLRARDESELAAQGLDPSTWVRDVIKKALEFRAQDRKELFPPIEGRSDEHGNGGA